LEQAMAEAAAESSRSLSRYAEQLDALVGKFILQLDARLTGGARPDGRRAPTNSRPIAIAS